MVVQQTPTGSPFFALLNDTNGPRDTNGPLVGATHERI